MKEKQPQRVYISEARNLLITTKELKSGIIYGDEISPAGVEGVEWKQGEEKHCLGTAIPVYGVVDRGNQILTEQLPFYFEKDFAVSAARQMNECAPYKEEKPYAVKRGYLFYPTAPR